MDYDISYYVIGGLEVRFTVVSHYETILTGRVKWDGCSDWSIPTNYHGCTRGELEIYGRLFTECWDLAANLIGTNWEGEC